MKATFPGRLFSLFMVGGRVRKPPGTLHSYHNLENDGFTVRGEAFGCYF